GTKKYLIRLEDGQCIEAVLMRYSHGNSLCVSSQVGCRMGCSFCASTKGGRVRNLTAAEMLDQIFLAEKEAGLRVSNVVIMGIGEPLDNFDQVMRFIELANEGFVIGQRKITLSTCGLIPEIERLADKNLQINLAISLHSPFQKQREILMPIAKRYDLKELLKVCNNYFTKTKRRITFEYALIDGFNDRKEDIIELKRLLGGTPCHVNLIGLNPVTESVYKGSKVVNFFSNELKNQGITCTIRRKIGDNIDAACGQLRQKAEEM
ncbi:MAG: 23S rRNA (adenine(2503)-C(2))-methyltransferase RlmN, partial [Eubacterium sp.]